MIEISNNGIIELTRGDYIEIPLFINLGNKSNPVRYSILKDSGATIHFHIRKFNESFENASVKKVFTPDSNFTAWNDLIIQLLPEDTLKLEPGKYYYSVKILRPENGHYVALTAVPERMLVLK